MKTAVSGFSSYRRADVAGCVLAPSLAGSIAGLLAGVLARELSWSPTHAEIRSVTYPDVSQFWTYDPGEFLSKPVYSRDYPPLRFTKMLLPKLRLLLTFVRPLRRRDVSTPCTQATGPLMLTLVTRIDTRNCPLEYWPIRFPVMLDRIPTNICMRIARRRNQDVVGSTGPHRFHCAQVTRGQRPLIGEVRCGDLAGFGRYVGG